MNDHATTTRPHIKASASPTPVSFPSQGSEQRVSIITGDRLCTRCGYNLTGQVVWREPHYQLLIVRCPECATVTGLQEYPMLGRWANRWAMLLAGIWVLLLLGLAFGSGAAIFGFSIGLGEVSSSKLSNALWSVNNAGTTPTAEQIAQKIEELGGWKNAVDWTFLWIMVPFTLVVFAIGCMWSVITVAAPWRGRFIAIVLITVIACFFAAMVLMEWMDANRTGPWVAGRRAIGIPFLTGGVAYGAFIALLGMVVGAAITRFLLRVLLPPRLCQALAVLWTARGLKPPKVHT